MSSLQKAMNEHRFCKRARDKEEDEPLQHMVKRLRVHDSPKPEEQVIYHQQPFQPSQYEKSHLTSDQQQKQQQQRQRQYPPIHQQRSAKYITHIHYHSNLGGDNTSSVLNHSGDSRETFQQSAGEDTCSNNRNNETISTDMVSPMNQFLGSLHQQRRLQRQQEQGKSFL